MFFLLCSLAQHGNCHVFLIKMRRHALLTSTISFMLKAFSALPIRTWDSNARLSIFTLPSLGISLLLLSEGANIWTIYGDSAEFLANDIFDRISKLLLLTPTFLFFLCLERETMKVETMNLSIQSRLSSIHSSGCFVIYSSSCCSCSISLLLNAFYFIIFINIWWRHHLLCRSGNTIFMGVTGTSIANWNIFPNSIIACDWWSNAASKVFSSI